MADEKWEYRLEEFNAGSDERAAVDCANQLGAKGWEMIAATQQSYAMWVWFKRRLLDGQ